MQPHACLHQSFDPESCKTCLRLERLAIERLSSLTCGRCGKSYLPSHANQLNCYRCQSKTRYERGRDTD